MQQARGVHGNVCELCMRVRGIGCVTISEGRGLLGELVQDQYRGIEPIALLESFERVV